MLRAASMKFQKKPIFQFQSINSKYCAGQPCNYKEKSGNVHFSPKENHCFKKNLPGKNSPYPPMRFRWSIQYIRKTGCHADGMPFALKPIGN
jgi:hypothetical protein